MAENALDLITNALLDIGVLADGETPSASMAQGALRKLNNLIDAWNIEGMMVYGSQETVYVPSAGVGTFTIGNGGDINIPRPSTITSAYLRNTALPADQRMDFPLYIFTNEEYADVRLKSQTSSLPLGVWFDEGFPLITGHFYPVPDSSTYSLVFWANGLIGNLGLYDAISLAPGYKRALEANLAVELAPGYQAQLTQVTTNLAASSKNTIRAYNLQFDELAIPTQLGGGWFDIRTRSYR